MLNTRDDSKKIRIVVVDDIAETRDNIRKLLYFEDDIEIIGAASNGREGIEMAAKLHPDIVLMDINMPETDGIAASEAITAHAPNVQIIMMSVQGEADYLRRSMLAGAREFLVKPFSSDELTTSIRRVYQLASTRRVAMPVAPPPVAEVPVGGPKKPTGAKVIALYSPKGGTGVSTIAVNLAIALREDTQKRVALIDASLQYGDLGLIMNLPTHRSISDLVDSKSELDEELLSGVVASHSSGVKVLLAPPRPELAELVTADAFKHVLQVLQKHYDYILIDTGRSVNDVLLSIFDAAEQIVLVATSDLAALKNCKLFFDVTEALHYLPEKTLLVLSKEEGKGISLTDIQNNLKHPIGGVIVRDDKTVNSALNRGVPFIIGQRAAPISQNILTLARLLKREAVETVVAAPASSTKPSAPPEKGPKRGLFTFGRK